MLIAVAGCDDVSGPAPTTTAGIPAVTAPAPKTTTSAAPAAPDYQSLLLTAADLSDAEDTFSQRSITSDPNGTPGASAFFVNAKDNRAISDTFLVYPDAQTAAASLKSATESLTTVVPSGTPTPAPVGTGGVMIVGNHPDENKAVTVLFFTEGKALVRLEFQSAPGDATTDTFVTSIGKMQQIALRVGLH